MQPVPNGPDINEVLADITSALVGHFKLDSLLHQVVGTSMRTLHAAVCSIFLEDRENDPGILTMKAGSGFAEALVDKARYQIGEGFTGAIAKSGRKFNIKSRYELEHLEIDGKRAWRGKFDGEQWPSGQSEFRNCIALPLKIKDHNLGVIKVENKRSEYGDHFTDQDERYIETIANVVALAIENARLHEQTEKQLKTIASKAAHRIHNQITNYDGIELDLMDQAHEAVPDKSRLAELAGRVRETTRSLKRMVEEFKNYGKPLNIVKQPADINKIIADEVWLAKPDPNIKIDKRLTEGPLMVNIDAGRFAEAIKELLRNSMKALRSRGGGHVLISTRVLQGRHDEPRQWVIEVSDTGPGFRKNLPLFVPFQSTDPQSTGLGLVTVKELVEAHRGTIAAVPNEQAGALIRIAVPL